MNIFHTLVLGATATVALALPAQGYWDAFQQDNIVDRHPQVIVDALAARGIKVERLEEVNDLVLAFVVEDDGSTSLKYFDPRQNYRQVPVAKPKADAPRVGTQVDVVTTQSPAAISRWSDEPVQSLTESDDDDDENDSDTSVGATG
jgi:hypothetical protein